MGLVDEVSWEKLHAQANSGVVFAPEQPVILPKPGDGLTPISMEEFKQAMRNVIADYMWSEGCSCCRDTDAHEENTKRIAELLDVPMYSDGSGYDFSSFRSTK